MVVALNRFATRILDLEVNLQATIAEHGVRIPTTITQPRIVCSQANAVVRAVACHSTVVNIAIAIVNGDTL